MAVIGFYGIKGIHQNAVVSAYNQIIDSEKPISKYEDVSADNLLKNYFKKYNNEDYKLEKTTGICEELLLIVDITHEHDYSLTEVLYLVELVCKLDSILNNIVVCFWSAGTLEERKTPDEKTFSGTDNDYFRLSQILRLWCLANNKYNNFCFAYLDIKNRNVKRRRIALEITHYNSNVLPIVDLSEEIYEVLSSPIERNDYSNQISDYYVSFKDESNGKKTGLTTVDIYRMTISQYIFTNLVIDQDSMNEWFCEVPALTLLLFIAYTSTKQVVDSRVLLELCLSYSRGILQIIENALIHPPILSESRAFFAFRTHERTERLFNYIEKCSVEDILEFIVSDIAIKEEYSKGITASFMEEKGIVVSLDELMEYPRSSQILKDYFSNHKNLINHYGLQIFSSLVESNGGVFYLTSGGEEYATKYDKKQLDESRLIWKKESKLEAFKGTTYTILLPQFCFEIKSLNYLVNPVISKDSLKNLEAIEFITVTDSIFDSINGVISSKEDDIAIMLLQLKEICKAQRQLALTIDFGLKTPYRIEVFIKAFISLMIEYNNDCKHFALEFDNATDLLESARICGLFYGRMGDCSMLNDESDLLLYINEKNGNVNGDSRRAQLYLSGKNITDIVNCLYFQKLNGTSFAALIEQMLYVYKPRIEDIDSMTASRNNDLVMKYKVINKATGLSLLCEDLKRVLETDVHDRYRLGCCLRNTHVQASNVHLDTFYEAHFLFGNAYWSTVFAMFLCEKILKDIVENPSESKNIVIFGYEVYSAGVLYKAKEYLEQNEGLNVHLIFLELGDNGEDKNRIRFFEHLKTDKEFRIWYFVGISSTLSTFNKMHTVFEENAKRSCAKLKEMDGKDHSYNIGQARALSVIQVGGINDDNNDISSELINLDLNSKIASSKIGYLDFLEEKNRFADYYVVVHSTWYKPCECPLCGLDRINKGLPLLEENTKELPLIEVGQTSVTPELLYVPENIKTPYKKYDSIKLVEFDKGRYVYCTHMQRGGNHYQYYLRLSLIYSERRRLITNWLNKIKAQNTNIDVSGKVINLLVSTNDYSYNSFVEDVNQCVFNGTAHTLSFDIKHENRLTFMAKYGYLAAFLGTDQHVRWYFIADRIVSGRNITRAKSLMTTLFSESTSGEFVKTKPNMFFSGVFVLCNQKSLLSIRALVEPDKYDVLPYYSAIDLHIPSFKSHSGLCPLCQYVDELTMVINSCALDCTVGYFLKLRNTYKLKDIQETHSYYKKTATEQEFNDNFVKLCCEDSIWEIVKRNDSFEKLSTDLIKLITEDVIRFEDSYIDRVNRLSIYLDCLSKPYLYTREKVKCITMDFLISIFRDIKSTLFSNTSRDVLNSLILVPQTKEEKEHLILLFGVVIERLCAIDSSELIKSDNLNCCITEALELEKKEGFDVSGLMEKICSGLKLLICQESSKAYSIQRHKTDKPIDNQVPLELVLIRKEQSSKSFLLDSILCRVFEDSGCNALFERLFLENISCNLIDPSLIVELERTVADYLHSNSISDLAEKYQYIFGLLHFDENTEISKKSWSFIPELFIRNDNESSKEAFSLSLVEKKEDINLDDIDERGYSWNEQGTAFYFSISSNSNDEYVKNYRSFKTIIKLDFHNNKLTKCENLICIRELLMYRSVILHFLELDFMQDVFNNYYQQRKAINDLTKLSSTIHGQPLLSGFSETFDYLLSHDKDEFYSLMDVYANTIISICNRYDLLQTGNGCNLDLPLYITRIDRSKSHIAIEAFDAIIEMAGTKENNFEIKKGADHVELKDKQVAAITLGGRDSKDLFDLAALTYILIKNAVDHGKPPCVVSIIQNESNNYDLVVKNYTKDKDVHKSGITHDSLYFLFDKNPEGSCRLVVKTNEDGEFTCIITNVIGG